MKILIIEDEFISSERLKKLLYEINEDVEIMKVCEGIEDSLLFLQDHHPDLIISDIQLKDGDVFQIISKYPKEILWIFISGSDDLVDKAFSNKAFDYLLKPIKINELKESIIRAKQYLKNGSTTDFNIKNSPFSIGFRLGSRYSFIRANQINYYYAKDKLIININRNFKTFPLSISLKTLFNHIDDKLFVVTKKELIQKLDVIRRQLNLKREQVKIVIHPELDSDLVHKKVELSNLNKRLGDLNYNNIAS